jgi:hypothetical protein
MFFNKTKKLLQKTETELLTCQTDLHNKTNEFNETLKKLSQANGELASCKESGLAIKSEYESFRTRYLPVIDVEAKVGELIAEVVRIKAESAELKEKYMSGVSLYKELQMKIALFEETLELAEYGVYQGKYSFEIPEQYKVELEGVYQQQKAMIKADTAVVCNIEWTIGGSTAEGKKMVKQYKKLMLYAFNGECDALIAKVKWNNVSRMEERIRSTFEAINKLGVTHSIMVTADFRDLKLKELALTYEYEQKKYEEKEEQRRIKEQMREEEKAQREFERAQKEAEDDERQYEKALEKAKTDLGRDTNPARIEELNEKIRLLEANLQEAHQKKERAISLAQMTKVGHIYVISNIGSFGENVYKIGMTRRFDPLDRVKELGDASVPFQFDIHAIIYSEDAPQLEYELHKYFAEKRINRINQRKEFFRVTLDEIETFVNKHTNAAIAFTKLAEAKEFRETMTLMEQIIKAIDKSTENQKGLDFPGSLDL